MQIYNIDNEIPATKKLINFYQRRIRRIVPVYLLVLCVVIYTGNFILKNDDFENLCRDALPALIFGTNIRNLVDKMDYWAQVRGAISSR